jgi:hypothetical protein
MAFGKYKFFKRLGPLGAERWFGLRVYFVNKRLAFGSAVTTWSHAEKLRALGITHIINLRWSQNNAKVRQFDHIWLRFHDDKEPRPRWFYRRALSFFRRAMRNSNTKLFVMCHHGRCRSASLAYFLLRASGEKCDRAERRVTRARATARVVMAYRETSEKYLRRIL